MEDQLSWKATPYRAPVLDAGGTSYGQAESLLGDEKEDIFHGLVVRLARGGRLVEVAADRVSMVTASAVHTSVPASEVASLPTYEPERWYHIEWGGLFRRRPEWKENG